MSAPRGKPAKSNILDYAPRHVREAGGPRRIDEEATPPRRPANEEPLDDPRPEEEQYDIPLAPEPPRDGIAAEEVAADDVAAEGIAAADQGHEDHDAAASDEAHQQPIDADRPDPQQGAPQETDFDKDLAQLADLLDSIRRGTETAAPSPTSASMRRPIPRQPLDWQPGSELYIEGMRVPRSLQPTFMPPPPITEPRAGYGKIIGGVTGACLLAAALAFVMVGNWHSPESPVAVPAASAPAQEDVAAADRPAARGPQLASATASLPAIAQRAAEPPPAVPTRQANLPAAAPHAVPVVRVAPTQAPAPAPWPTDTPASVAPKAPTVAPPMPAAAPKSPTPPRPHLTMDAQEIKLLLEQGKQFISVGDLVTARTVLQRVADADVPAGAFALAETYDPAVLAKQGVRGLQGDVEQARHWYARARELGSDEAGRRLTQLSSQ
jgi:hypothetical protein